MESAIIFKALLQRPKEWWRMFQGLGAKFTLAEPHGHRHVGNPHEYD